MLSAIISSVFSYQHSSWRYNRSRQKPSYLVILVIKVFFINLHFENFYYLFVKALLKKIIVHDKRNPINNPIREKKYEDTVLILSDIPLSDMGL
jgi:hypothetical protein